MAAEADPIYRLVSTALDATFYRAINDDVARARLDPVRHYIDEGWREGRDPAPWFSTRAYLERNPDVADLNPFHHYLTRGWREGREAEASSHGAPHLWRLADAGAAAGWTSETSKTSAPLVAVARPAPPRSVAATPDHVRARVAEAFDTEYYLAANPDIAAAGCDPVEHFLNAGWLESRDPTRTFSVDDYLELNPDVAAAGMNPFVHYLMTGQAEGRAGRHDLGFRHQVIARLKPVAARLEEASRRAAKIQANRPDVLEAALAESRCDDAALHISVSHDDFTTNVGGVQLCLQREAAAIAAQGVDHLHLYPTTHWPTLRGADRPAAVGVLWNGRDLGAYPAHAVVRALGRRGGGAAGRRSFALHSLLGHSVDEVLDILAAAGLTRGFFWLHDFTSLCAGVHLMRDDVADCGAPPIGSPACGICIYGAYRTAHVEAHAKLFAALDLTVVAPSQSAFDIWRKAARAPARQPYLIHPHARLRARGSAPAGEHRQLTVAFLGMPSIYKGWPVFSALATRFLDDPRYRFLHLASAAIPGAPAEFHQVSVTADRPDAMRDALEALGVDVAVIWSLCRETFSFTAHESVAAGVAVVTGPDSGNVAAFVAEGGHGRVAADEDDLMAMFETGEVLSLARAVRRPPAYDLMYSALTVDLLEPR